MEGPGIESSTFDEGGPWVCPPKLAEGALISHLLELRDRLLRALVAVGIAFLPLYYSNDLFTFVAQPLIARLPEGSNLIATGVMSPQVCSKARDPFLRRLKAAGVHASPPPTSRDWCRHPPAALCESHIGDAEILGQLPHRLGPSELVEIFARHGQRRFFVFVHSDLSRLVKLEPAFSLAP
jgi:hypothetical protein